MADYTFITPSEVIEYLFCPRFTYFLNVLKIEQYEDRRALVLKGRHIHDQKKVQNKDYLRKKIGAVDKKIEVYMTSQNLRLVGKVDEVLFLNDGTAAPLDYKYTFWEDKVYSTYEMQQTLYALLMMENFNVDVNKGFIVYTRSSNYIKEINITKKMKEDAIILLDNIFEIIDLSVYPEVKASKNKCSDCTYRNICVS